MRGGVPLRAKQIEAGLYGKLQSTRATWSRFACHPAGPAQESDGQLTPDHRKSAGDRGLNGHIPFGRALKQSARRITLTPKGRPTVTS